MKKTLSLWDLSIKVFVNRKEVTGVPTSFSCKKRPRSPQELAIEPEIIQKMRGGVPGKYELRLPLGAGVGAIVENPLEYFFLGSGRIWENLTREFPFLAEGIIFSILAPFRDAYAPSRSLCLDTSSGILEEYSFLGNEDINSLLLFNAIKEIVELGIFLAPPIYLQDIDLKKSLEEIRKINYARYILPNLLAKYQEEFDKIQSEEWQSVSSQSRTDANVRIELFNQGIDSFNGIPCNVTIEQSGTCDVVFPVFIKLPPAPKGKVYFIRDTESGANGLLDRSISLTSKIKGFPCPVCFFLDKNGLNPYMPLLFLEGAQRKNSTTEKVERLLSFLGI